MSLHFDAEQLLNCAGDGIVAASADGSIVFWNPAATRIFGYAEYEALGHSLDLIIPERFRHRHWEGYRQVMETGETRYGADILRVPASHKDGRNLSIAFTVALIASPHEHDYIIAAIIRDETQRWKEERLLRTKLAGFEA